MFRPPILRICSDQQRWDATRFWSGGGHSKTRLQEKGEGHGTSGEA